MNYFGEPWNSQIETYTQMPTPVGHFCMWCEEEFVEGDKGFLIGQGQVLVDNNNDQVFEELAPVFLAVHLECFLRQTLGSVGHQTKQCSCFGGILEDPPELTKRQAARAAVDVYKNRPENHE